jgi:3-dehydroquinate synthetase
MGLLPAAQLQRHLDLLTAAGLPTRIPRDPKLSIDKIVALANEGDKKAAGGRAKFVLVADTGRVHLFNGKEFTGYVDERIVREAIAENMER